MGKYRRVERFLDRWEAEEGCEGGREDWKNERLLQYLKYV